VSLPSGPPGPAAAWSAPGGSRKVPAASASPRDRVADRLARAGCVAAGDEADELVAAAGGDGAVLDALLARREQGEPLAWVTGWADVAGLRVRVRPGVYVPRPQSVPLALRAAELLPARGVAVDLCTGSGAVACVLARARPHARVVATDLDPLACAVAAENGAENGVRVYEGHLAEPLPADLTGHADVVVAVPPYVPSREIAFLPRDARDHEPLLALDGGLEGTTVLADVVAAAGRLLHRGGTLLVELGGNQDAALAGPLDTAGFGPPRRHEDADGDLRGLEALLR
jgi:release factor glutamine methyltransferase